MKTVRVVFIQYTENSFEMQDLAKYPPPPSMKEDKYFQSDWANRDKLFNEYDIRVATKDGLPTSIQDKMEH